MSDEKKDPVASEAAATMLADLHGTEAPKPEGETPAEAPAEEPALAPESEAPAAAPESPLEASEEVEAGEGTPEAPAAVTGDSEAVAEAPGEEVLPEGGEGRAEEPPAPSAEGVGEGEEGPDSGDEALPASLPEGGGEAPAAGPPAAPVGADGEGTAPAAVEGEVVAPDAPTVAEEATPSFGEVRGEVADLGDALPKEAIKALRAAGDATFNFLADMAEVDWGKTGQESQARLQSVYNKAVFFLSAIEGVFTRS